MSVLKITTNASSISEHELVSLEIVSRVLILVERFKPCAKIHVWHRLNLISVQKDFKL